MADVEAGTPPSQPATNTNNGPVQSKADIARQQASGNLLFKLFQGGTKVYGAMHPGEADIDDDGLDGDDGFDDDFDFSDDDDDVDDSDDIDTIQDGDEPWDVSEEDSDDINTIQDGDEPLDVSEEDGLSGGATAAIAAAGAGALGVAALAAAKARSNTSTTQPAVTVHTDNSRSLPPSSKTTPVSEKGLAQSATVPTQPQQQRATNVATAKTSDSPSTTPTIHKRASSLKAVKSSSTKATSKVATKPVAIAATPAGTTTKVEPSLKAVEASLGSTATKAAVASSAATKSAPAKPNPLAPTPQAPYGYKAVKVKKPDGTIATVKRPLSAEEAAKIEEQKKVAAAKVAARKTAAQSKADAIEAVVSEKPTVQTKSSGPAVKGPSDTRPIEIQEKEIGLSPVAGAPAAGAAPALSRTSKGLRRTAKFMSWLSWFIMITFPILFLVLAAICAGFNEKPVRGEEQKYDKVSGGYKSTDPLTQARNVAVSMWPIVFAAIVAQTLRALAAYRVERGIPLVTLEQLVTSNSLGGAIKQPFMLRKLNLMTIILLSVWALSPLAGQAIVRMSFNEPWEQREPVKVNYFPPQKMNYTRMEFAENPIDNIQHVAQVDAMYTGSLIANKNARQAAADYWGNVKIPRYDYVISYDDDGNMLEPGPDGWTSYASWEFTSGTLPYYGLIGIPASLVSDAKNGSVENSQNAVSILDMSFNITSSHFNVSCSQPERRALASDFVKGLNLSTSPAGTLYLSVENNTQLFTDENETSTVMGPGPNGVIHFGSADLSGNVSEPGIFYSRCEYQQYLLLNEVTCSVDGNYQSCYVSGQKMVNTDLDGTFKLQPLGRYFTYIMLNCGGNSIAPGPATETEQYIHNPDFASSKGFWNKTEGFASVTQSEMNERFSEAINTLWLAGTKHKAILGGNLTSIYESSGKIFNIVEVDAMALTGYINYYQVSWPWCIVLIVCSVLLLLAAVAAIILERGTIGPDFLGFANTAIRKGVKVPKHMVNMSARDRLHALAETEVLLQDVRPADVRGRIALGIKDETAVPLMKGRDYR